MQREERIIREQSALIGELIRKLDEMRHANDEAASLHGMSLMLAMQKIMAENCGGYFPIGGYRA